MSISDEKLDRLYRIVGTLAGSCKSEVDALVFVTTDDEIVWVPKDQIVRMTVVASDNRETATVELFGKPSSQFNAKTTLQIQLGMEPA